MLKFLLYIIVFVIVFLWGLAIGAANDVAVEFDALFVKAQMSVSTVFAIGVAVGVILGIYASLLFCFKVWKGAHSARVENKRYKRNEQLKLEQEKESD